MSSAFTTWLADYRPESPVPRKVAEIIRKKNDFILTTHVNSDADGIGSELALYHLLRGLGKRCRIINNEKPGSLLSFLDGVEAIENVHDLPEEQLLADMKKAHIFILDSSELKRSEKVAELFQKAESDWGTIDHHDLPESEHFHVDASYAATCEMIWDIYKELQAPISAAAAVALYTGIVADSGNFRYPKTSLRTHLAGAELVTFPEVHTDFIYRRLYESQPIDRLRLMARVLTAAEIDPDRKFAIGIIRRETYDGLHLGDSPNEGLVNILLGVDGMRLAGLATETEEGELKCSLRSVGDVDVAAIARKFGGGGHKNAAGLKISEPFESAIAKIREAIRSTLG